MAEVQPPEPHPPNGAAPQLESVGRKRHRRPSVRLGDSGGDQGLLHCDSTGAHSRRGGGSGNKQSRANSNQSQNLSVSDCKKDGISKTSSRTRALTNLAIGSWKVRDTKRRVSALPAAARRARFNWGRDSEFKDTGGNVSNGVEDSGDGDRDDEAEEEDGYRGRGFILACPVEGEGNVDGNGRYGKGGFSRLDGAELSGPSDNDAREYENNNAGRSGLGNGEDVVRIWLSSVGLGRYAPVFEVHEVDDEVLPMLTLEDLKDMGISAVGSRRKMFCAIQKLVRGFS